MGLDIPDEAYAAGLKAATQEQIYIISVAINAAAPHIIRTVLDDLEYDMIDALGNESVLTMDAGYKSISASPDDIAQWNALKIVREMISKAREEL